MSHSSFRVRLYRPAALGGLLALLALAGAASAASPDTQRAIIGPVALISGGPYVLRGLAAQPQAGVGAGGAVRLSAGWLAPATAAPSATTPAPTPPTPQKPSATPTDTASVEPTLTPPPTAPPSATPAACLTSVPGRYDPPASEPGPNRLFLPAVLHGTDPVAAVSLQPAAPDLVTQFEVCRLAAPGRTSLRVTVTNIGQAATPADGFWVEAYLNPAVAPVRAQPWDEACTAGPCYGATWRVDRPLNPGESVMLSDTDLASGYRRWPATAPDPIQALFVYADSQAEAGDPAGLIREADEGNNRSDLPAACLTSEGVRPCP